jgi:iron complex outermembrane recepter protein
MSKSSYERLSVEAAKFRGIAMTILRKAGLVRSRSACIAMAMGTLLNLSHASAADEGATLEEVIVTAQKRDESELKVPIAMSTIDEKALEALQVSSVLDLEGTVPGLSIGYYSTAPKIAIRGIGSEALNYGGDPGVAFHADGVYIGREAATQAAFYDIERVEVLRGPQGTLYGRNTTGGSINVIFRKPTQEFDAELSGAYGNHGTYEVGGVINGPLSENVAARLSLKRDFGDGSTPNVYADHENLDDKDTMAARGQLLFTAGDRVSVLLEADYYKDQRRGPAIKFLGGPDGALTAAEGPPYNGQRLVTLDERAVVGNKEPRTDMEFWGAAAKFDVGFDSMQLRSITAYRSHEYATIDYEGDGTDADFSDLSFFNDIWQASQEFQLLSTSDAALQWMAGAYYFREDGGFDRAIPFFKPALLFTNGGTVLTESYAAYGHVDYTIGRTKLFAGLRYSSDTKSMTEFLRLFGTPVAGTNSGEDSWSDPSWDVGVEFSPSEGSMLFAKVAHGFKSGGWNTGSLQRSSYNPEYVTSYEAGYKASLLDRRAQLSLSAFLNDYKDLQQQQVDQLASIFRNATSAETKGAELSLRTQLTHSFGVDLTAAWLDAKFEDFRSIDTSRRSKGLQNLAGNSLPQSPEFKYSITPRYSLELGDRGSLDFTVNYYWQDKVYFNAFNEQQVSQDAVGRVDARVDFHTWNDRFNLSLYGRNLTDEIVYGYIAILTDAIGSPHFGYYDESRAYGIRATWRF